MNNNFSNKIVASLVRVGNSAGILIPKKLMEQHDLKLTDEIEYIFRKIEGSTKTYRCKKDEHYFDSDQEIVECPICGDGGDSLELIEYDKNFNKIKSSKIVKGGMSKMSKQQTLEEKENVEEGEEESDEDKDSDEDEDD